MKKLLLLLALLLCGISQAWAAEWTDSNGISWTFDVRGTEATNIKPTDKNTISGDIIIPAKVYYDETELTVTSIYSSAYYNSGAFYNCTSLTSVTIPEGVTSIGNYAFYNCTSLTSVTIPEGVTSIGNYAFYNCYSLTSVTIPEGVTSIGYYAFYNCTGLTSVTIPEGVTSIGYYAFYNCTGLTSVTIPEGVTSIDFYAFYNCTGLTSVTIPEGVTSIGYYAFSTCTGLTSVTIPSSVTTIVERAFSGCSRLTSVTIPEGVTRIGNYVFSNCTSLTSVTIPSSVTSIGEGVFSGCSGLTSMTINATEVPSLGGTFPDDVIIYVPDESLEEYLAADVWKDMELQFAAVGVKQVNISALETSSALYSTIGEENLSNILSLKIIGSINSYDIMIIRNKMAHLRYLDLSEATIVASDYEYYSGCKTENNKIGKNMFRESNLKTIQLPQGVTSIGEWAFYECRGLTSVTIPQGVTRIGDDAFCYCRGLTSVTFPSSVTSIGGEAFAYCTGLTSVTIPEGVTRIGSDAFAYCTGLKDLHLAPTVKRIEGWAFENCRALTELRLPPMLESVGESAFAECSNLKDYYIYVVDPISIDMSSFSNYQTATLHVPTQSYQNYYWNTQWSQFASLTEFDEPYTMFYTHSDYTLAEDKRFDGEPNAEFHNGSGFIVEGGDNQALDEVHVAGDGTEAASVIDEGNITVNSMTFDIDIQANRWYFFAFPFRVKVSDIVAPGHYALRWYDAAERAANGQGGWKNYTGEYLEPGIGYIFQCNAKGTLHLPATNATFNGQDIDSELEVNASANDQDASWNFMGNPWLSYFDINDCGFDAPFTIWNGSSYDAYCPGDDDYLLHPFQAFFVQTPSGNHSMHFGHGNRYTHHQGQNHMAAAHAKRMAKGINPSRLRLDMTISDGTNTDRTRVVFNSEKQNLYEVGTDAAKFLSANMPQLYTLDAKEVRYAINERPQGEVKLGFNAPTAGTYTIAMQRMDQPMLLRDMLTGRTVSLTDGDYTFDSEAGMFDNRFLLVMDNGTTGIAQLFQKTGVSVIGADGGLYINGAENGEVSVYNTAGALVAQQTGNGHTALPRGAYIVKVNGVSVKVAVK